MKRVTLALVFSCEFSKIFKTTFFYRTTPVAASEKEADSATPTTLSKTITFDVKTECLFLKITKTQRRHKIEKIKSNWRNYLICTPDWGCKIHQKQRKHLFSDQQLQWCKWFFELEIISALLLIAEIHLTANPKNLTN